MTDLFRTTLEGDGVLLAVLDMPDKKMNVFSAALIEALDALMDRVDGDPAIKSVVLTSGKATFLAGADLVMVRGFTGSAKNLDDTGLRKLCGRLGRQFVRLEASKKPWVAAVNGLALGGGLELALACRARLVTDDPRTQIGVPEVRWGLLPGAGGTQRLPRLAPFDSAMDMLLTGKPIAPAEAVRLGVFARAVPAAELLDAAREIARSLHGKPFDPETKFTNLAQSDVPQPNGESRKAIATRHGVSAQDLELYPAYGAIIGAVLEGARLPLAEASEIEMTHFLHLMRSPVAGRMVRTLYLERLRADKAIAVPATLKIEKLVVGPISGARAAWSEALAKVKLPQTADASLPADTLDIVDETGAAHRLAVRVSSEAASEPAAGSSGAAVLSPAGPYGRVLEIVGAGDGDAPVFAALAARLFCLPWRTAGSTSVLQQLHGRSLAEQAQVALVAAAAPGAGDPVFFDVAACLAGETPAWTGGPLTWLWSEQSAVLPELDATGRAAWDKLEPTLRHVCA